MTALSKKLILIALAILIIGCDDTSTSNNYADRPVERSLYNDLSNKYTDVAANLQSCETTLKAEIGKNKNIKQMKADAESKIQLANDIANENLALVQKNKDLTTENTQIKAENQKINDYANGDLLYRLKNLDFNSKLILGVLIAFLGLVGIFALLGWINRSKERLKAQQIENFNDLKTKFNQTQDELINLENRVSNSKIELLELNATIEKHQNLINMDVVAEKQTILDEAKAEADHYYNQKIAEIEKKVADENAKLKNQRQQLKQYQEEQQQHLADTRVELEAERQRLITMADEIEEARKTLIGG
jgi:chromosome segregation ATPase